MLPWWFWILIWTVLVLSMLLAAVLAGIRLFRQGMGVIGALGDAAEKFSHDLAQEGTVVQYTPRTRIYPSGTDATHADPEWIRQLKDTGKAERIEARRIRRVARRTARSQPQNVYDLHLF
ncbi:hypothetical protein OK351_05135 [Glutamicibacter sp. MNS18]|uniref:hypothetical protein n=1 Tax=Glutamicibacter sp. MNS18 TaxID=2989817 RepID=UPI002236764B|nr:hypothetical protein [Glutamicibacter sp. MNS18]MCW4464890.1 hypothetical protein [Glutamicibacter sp. MNS18]